MYNVQVRKINYYLAELTYMFTTSSAYICIAFLFEFSSGYIYLLKYVMHDTFGTGLSLFHVSKPYDCYAKD